MAQEIFLSFEPKVDGECQAKGHEDEIDVESFSLGAANPTDIASGSGAGAGKVSITGLNLNKKVDLSSSELFLYCCTGKHFDGAKLVVREAGGDEPIEYYVIEMKQVFINDITWNGISGDSAKPSEAVNLACAEYKVTYNSQSEKGGVDKTKEVGFNLKQNATV